VSGRAQRYFPLSGKNLGEFFIPISKPEQASEIPVRTWEIGTTTGGPILIKLFQISQQSVRTVESRIKDYSIRLCDS